MADKDPDPFAEFGGQAEAEPEPDPFAEFGGQAEPDAPGSADEEPALAPPEDPLVFESYTADDPRLKVKGKTLPEHGIAKEADAADYVTSGFGGLAQGASFGMRAPLDYVTAAAEKGLEGVAPIEGPDAIPRGASAPGIDAPVTESGFDQSLEATKAVRKEAEEAAPTTNLVGNVLGTVGSAVIPGAPIAKVAKGAAWAGEQVGAQLAGRAAQLLAKGSAAPIRQGLFARALGKTAELGAEGYLASAPFGAAHQLDKAIEAKDFDGVAEKMLSGAHHEGLTGAGYNVALGGALHLARKATPSLSSVSDFASGRAFKGLGGKKKDIALAEMRVQGGGEAVGRQMLDEGIIQHGDSSLEGTLERAEAVRDSIGFQLGQVRKQIGGMGEAPSASSLWDKIDSEVLAPQRKSSILRKDANAVEARLADLRDELTANRPAPIEYDSLGMPKAPKGATFDEAGMRPATPEDLVLRQRMQAARSTGEASPEALGLRVPPKEYDSLGMEISPRPAPTTEIDAPVVSPEDVTSVADTASPYAATSVAGAPDMVPVPGQMHLPPDEIDFDRLTNLRIDVDKRLAQFDSQSEKPAIEMYRKVRSVMERHWMEAAEEAAARTGNPEIITQVKDLAQRYAKVATGTNLLKETVARKAANRTFGMSDTQLGQIGAGIGGSIGGAVFGAGGIAPGATVGGVIGGIGNKIVREQGNAFGSSVLYKTTRRALRVQNRLKDSAALRGIVSPKAIPVTEVGRKLKQEEEEKPDVLSAIERAEKMQDPESEESREALAALQGLEAESGPELAQAMTQKLATQNEFILEKAGPAPPPSPFGGPPPKRQIDPETEEQLARYISAMNDPSEALARVGDGQALPEDYEVLETHYPKMWEEFQQTAVQGLADKNLDYDQQLAVAGALKLPLHPSMQGDYMSFWQGMAANEPPPEPELPQVQSVTAHLSGGENVSGKADRAMA